MRSEYAPRTSAIGTGAVDAYTFDFKIGEERDLLVIVLDDTGAEYKRVRGDDRLEPGDTEADYIESVDFTENGGGTVTLIDPLPADYTIYLLLASDEPTQPYRFRNKAEFVMREIENALDWLGGALQSAIWFSKRAVRLHDGFDNDDFDPQLPIDIADNPDASIVVGADGLSLVLGPTSAALAQATADALAAAASATAAAVSAAAAAAAATASQGIAYGPFAITEGQAATALTGMSFDSASVTKLALMYAILRGTTVLSTGWLKLHYRNSTWYVLDAGDDADDTAALHGVTFTKTGTTIAQLKAAVASDGAGDGTIQFLGFSFT